MRPVLVREAALASWPLLWLAPSDGTREAADAGRGACAAIVPLIVPRPLPPLPAEAGRCRWSKEAAWLERAPPVSPPLLSTLEAADAADAGLLAFRPPTDAPVITSAPFVGTSGTRPSMPQAAWWETGDAGASGTAGDKGLLLGDKLAVAWPELETESPERSEAA
jgi:hypothetical protein